jgi:hypothetical protein
MAPSITPRPLLSGGDPKALAKELTKARAMTTALARRAAEPPQAEMCARCASPWPKEMFSPGIS